MAFDLDDLDPRHKKAPPKNLDSMSIEDLDAYVAALKSKSDVKINQANLEKKQQ